MFTVLETKIYDNDSPPSDWRNLSSCLWFSFATFIGESVMRLNYEDDDDTSDDNGLTGSPSPSHGSAL